MSKTSYAELEVGLRLDDTGRSLEPAAPGLEDRCAIQVSYGRGIVHDQGASLRSFLLVVCTSHQQVSSSLQVPPKRAALHRSSRVESPSGRPPRTIIADYLPGFPISLWYQ